VTFENAEYARDFEVVARPAADRILRAVAEAGTTTVADLHRRNPGIARHSIDAILREHKSHGRVQQLGPATFRITDKGRIEAKNEVDMNAKAVITTDEIRDVVDAHPGECVSELRAHVACSEPTLRKVLAAAENEGKVYRVDGWPVRWYAKPPSGAPVDGRCPSRTRWDGAIIGCQRAAEHDGLHAGSGVEWTTPVLVGPDSIMSPAASTPTAAPMEPVGSGLAGSSAGSSSRVEVACPSDGASAGGVRPPTGGATRGDDAHERLLEVEERLRNAERDLVVARAEIAAIDEALGLTRDGHTPGNGDRVDEIQHLQRSIANVRLEIDRHRHKAEELDAKLVRTFEDLASIVAPEGWDGADAELVEAIRPLRQAADRYHGFRSRVAQALGMRLLGDDEQIVGEARLVRDELNRVIAGEVTRIVPPAPEGLVDVRIVVAVDAKGQSEAWTSSGPDDDKRAIETVLDGTAWVHPMAMAVVLARVPAPRVDLPVIDLRGRR
jgi:hypothetical protein